MKNKILFTSEVQTKHVAAELSSFHHPIQILFINFVIHILVCASGCPAFKYNLHILFLRESVFLHAPLVHYEQFLAILGIFSIALVSQALLLNTFLRFDFHLVSPFSVSPTLRSSHHFSYIAIKCCF